MRGAGNNADAPVVLGSRVRKLGPPRRVLATKVESLISILLT